MIQDLRCFLLYFPELGLGSLFSFGSRFLCLFGNLGGCRILYQGFQHWPLSIGEWFPSSTASLDFEVDMEITGDPSEFVVEAYNLDDSFPHTLWVAFNILRPGEAPLTAEQVERIFATARGVLELPR